MTTDSSSLHPMTTDSENRKRTFDPAVPDASEQRQGSRKVAKVQREMRCPICEVTLWPRTVEQHYQQELARLSNPTPSLAHTKKKRAPEENKLFQRARRVLEGVRRRQILFNQRSDSAHASASTADSPVCPVCNCPLPLDESAAETHVTECLRRAGDSDSEEEYEEYTWCNVTRVRATSMLSPQARANMFDGTIISKGESSQENEGEVDVEDDETATYGPPQFGEHDVELTKEAYETPETELEVPAPPSHQLQCLICMDSYRNPLVSIKCWHVYCEKCWLKALGTKKVCPKCKDITSSSDLRKVFL